MRSSVVASPRAGSPVMPLPASAHAEQQHMQQDPPHAKSLPRVGDCHGLEMLADIAALQNFMSARAPPGLGGRNAGDLLFTQCAPFGDMAGGREPGEAPMEIDHLPHALADRQRSAVAFAAQNGDFRTSIAAASYGQGEPAVAGTSPIATATTAKATAAEPSRHLTQNSQDLRRLRTMLRYAYMKVRNNCAHERIEQVIKRHEHERLLLKQRIDDFAFPSLGTASLPGYTTESGAIDLRRATIKEAMRVEGKARPPCSSPLDHLIAACAMAAEELMREDSRKKTAAERRARTGPAGRLEGKAESGGGKAPRRRISVKVKGLKEAPGAPTPGRAQGNDAGGSERP